MTPAALRLGTRGSALALAQSRQVAAAITAATGIPVDLVMITSAGDVTRASLSVIGGTGVFATALRDALLAGECDLLVHSLKDLPTAPAPGLVVAAVPVRADARDVVVTRIGATLDDLERAPLAVGTGSPRRAAQLGTHGALEVVDLRGNVDSRLARVRDGRLDAVVLAAAGLDRLSAAHGDTFTEGLVVERMSLDTWPTAPGQGALAIEVREGDTRVAEVVAHLDDPSTRAAVEAERAVLAVLEAGCHAPVGATATVEGGVLRLRAVVYSLDGLVSVEAQDSEPLGGDAVGATVAVDGAGPVGVAASAAGTGDYADESGSGDGADAAGEADPIARAVRAGARVARRLLSRGAADLTD